MIHAYATHRARQPLKPFEYQPDDPGPLDVEIAISHCGICHSDLHLINDDWGLGAFPLVPGHEIVGTVKRKGDQVRHLETGQRVGVGWQCGACFSCEFCRHGEENFCADNQATCVGRFGGFADAIVVDSRFAFAIPEKLASENAAPLLCGGITVYAPLRNFHVHAAMKVGVVGIGGLGHLALQYAHAFGCEVTAFSSSPDKEAEARKLGANHFISSKDEKTLAEAGRSLDFILSTVSADLDWPSYLNILRPKGKLCVVGVPEHPLSIPAVALIGGQKAICGSPIGSRSMIEEMLAFSARHDIQAQTEIFPMSEVNSALEKLAANKVRYRTVLTN